MSFQWEPDDKGGLFLPFSIRIKLSFSNSYLRCKKKGILYNNTLNEKSNFLEFYIKLK